MITLTEENMDKITAVIDRLVSDMMKNGATAMQASKSALNMMMDECPEIMLAYYVTKEQRV